MKNIELIPKIKTSVIGFGCAPIMGSVDSKMAKYALDMAMERGVNYFDLARSYGYGEAERFVGETIKERKNEVYVATKFGVEPNWKANMLNQMKPMVRYLKGLKKKSIKTAQRQTTHPSEIANRLLDRIAPLRSKDMLKSLEKSLKELNRDYVDLLFIHEPLHSLEYVDELFNTAESLKKEGKILGFGLAARHSQEELHKNYVDRFDILQYDNPLIRTDYENFARKNNKDPSIIFSPFNAGPSTMEPSEKLRKLLVDFPNSVVLCSMFNPKHIIENIRIAKNTPKDL